MGHIFQTDEMFGEIKFLKSGREIAAQANLKIEQVKLKIQEREARIAQVCEQHRLGAADLFALADEQSDDHRRGPAYRPSVRDIPAGVATALAKESRQVESERSQVRTLGLLTRNIALDTAHELTFFELQYLGF